MINPQQPDEQLSTLLAVIDAANSAHNPDDLARHILDRVLATPSIDGGGIWLLDRDEIFCLVQRGLDQWLPDVPPRQPLTTNTPVGQALADRRPQLLAARGSNGAHAPEQRPTLAIMPLIAGGAPIGAFVFASAEELTEEELPPLLNAITAHTATALRQTLLAQEVKRLREQFEAQDRQRDEFLSIISHELKNPLASIKGYADLMLRRSAKIPDDPNRKGLDIVSQQVTRTISLLEQISDIARIGMDRLQLDQYKTDLVAITRQVVDQARGISELHQIILEETTGPIVGNFDELRIAQVLGNLLSNAIKYAPNGGPIEVSIRRVDGEQGAEALLLVHDHGVGIPAEERDRIFERFYRARRTSGSVAGMGVGLFIAQAIVTRHGGRIWFESKERQGTTFHVALPL